MSQRNSGIGIPEPTSVRRSPRLLQLKLSPKTPIPISSRKPSIIPEKSAINTKECCHGSEINADSANGSTRKSNLGSGIVAIRRSPRFCNEVTSLSDCEITDGSLFSNATSRRRLKQVSLARIDSLGVNDVVDFPVTPIGVGDKKCRYVNGELSNGKTNGSFLLSLGDSERRVTRSCAKKLSGNVEIRELENNGLKNGNPSDSRGSGGELRKCVRTSRGEIRRNDDCKGKEGGVDRILVCGLENVRFDPLSPCATPRVERGRRYSQKDMDGIKGRSDNLNECLTGNFEKRITRSALKSVGKENNLCDQDGKKGGMTEAARNLKGRSDDLYEGLTDNFERRITRSALKSVGKENDLCGQDRKKGGTTKAARNLLGNGDATKVIEKKVCRTEKGKRVKKASDKSLSARPEVEETPLRDVGVKEYVSRECGKKGGDKSKNASTDIAHATKLIGGKRKRKQAGLQGKDSGWTNEQEAALQRAYFAAKPSPHFWKKVSKLVPGKSAQECFDKVHSVSGTPLSSQHSSRIKKHISPEFSLKSDELLKPVPTKSKSYGRTKQRSHVARRNVRHLIRKYCQDSEPDLFSILEPSGNSPGILNLKTLSPGSSGFPSSVHNKRLSRLSGLSRSPLTSPLVLKKVKNMALHDKYIDQLHVREGKRKAVFSRHLKSSVQCQKNGTQNCAKKKDVVKAAKEALVSDARDVIEKFQLSQTNLMEAYSDSEEILMTDNDEDDTGM